MVRSGLTVEAFEKVFVDGVDKDDVDEGFLSFSGAVYEEHLGTSGQAVSTLLSGAIAG